MRTRHHDRRDRRTPRLSGKPGGAGLLHPRPDRRDGSALAVDVNMAKLALGNWPDAGYKGDPTFHGPKQADWGYLVGSFKYSLYRLQERVVGQGPNPPAPAPAPQPEPAPAPEPGPGR